MTQRANLDAEAIVRGYLEGKTLRDLAVENGVTLGPIQRVLREHGVQMRPTGVRGPDRAPRVARATRKRLTAYTQAERLSVVQRWSAGETMESIARSLDCSPSMVDRLMIAEGVEPGKRYQLRERHHNWKGGRRVDENGYVMVRVESDDEIGQVMKANSQYVFEHRLVMAHALGRPLTSEETVHHGPGGRQDNRIENLELWASRHPRGQRIEDLVEFAREILDLYGDVPSQVQSHT